jgi:Zn-dependent protease with chaperone function
MLNSKWQATLLAFLFLAVLGALSGAQVRAEVVTVGSAIQSDSLSGIYPPSPERRELLESYSSLVSIWRFVSFFVTVGVLALIAFTGWPNHFRKWASVIKVRFLSNWLYLGILIVVIYLLSFPFSYYRSFMVEHQFGFSNQTFMQWWGEDLLSLLITIIIAIIPFSLFYWAFRRFRRWYLVFAAGFLPIIIFLVVIAPVVISPLFNDFKPLGDQALKQDIQHLASTAGIEGSDIFEVDASRQSSKINAYVTGLFATKRIVLYDTLIKNFSRDEILFVMAHEMGHYVMNHVWWGVLVGAVLVFLGGWLVDLTIRPFIRKFHRRLGYDSLGNVASFPLVLLFVVVINFVFQPIGNGISRVMEHQADVYGLETADVTKGEAIRAFDKLSVFNLSNPDPNPVIEFWFYTHPSLKKRMAFVESFKR